MKKNKKDRILNEAIELIKSKKLIRHENVFNLLGISKQTYYNNFPSESEEHIELDNLLRYNRVINKIECHEKWRNSDVPTLQIAWYKLNADLEELKILCNYIEPEEKEVNEDDKIIINLNGIQFTDKAK